MVQHSATAEEGLWQKTKLGKTLSPPFAVGTYTDENLCIEHLYIILGVSPLEQQSLLMKLSWLSAHIRFYRVQLLTLPALV